MVIRKNPYDVTLRVDVVTMYEFCACCELRFACHMERSRPVVQTVCPECRAHNLEGSTEDVIKALREHEPRFRNWIVAVHEKASEQEAEIMRLKGEARERGEQIGAALRTRNRWRDVAAAMMDEHEPEGVRGLCRCGHKYPCPTVQAAYEVDYGIARSIERDQGARDLARFQLSQHVAEGDDLTGTQD